MSGARTFSFGLEGVRQAREWQYDTSLSALAAERARLALLQDAREQARLDCANKVLDSALAWKSNPDPGRQSAALLHIAAAQEALARIDQRIAAQEIALQKATVALAKALAAKDAIDRLRDDELDAHISDGVRASDAAADEAWILRTPPEAAQ